MFKKENKFKGRKCYGIIRPDSKDEPICIGSDMEETKGKLDSIYTILCELTITRVFTRERDIKEIENEIN
jgi:hypothetical protein